MPTKVVYIHGMGGSTDDWRPVQARQPGLSLSPDWAAETPEECAALLADAVLKHVSGSFALCGYSMGGRIALLAAAELVARRKKPDGVILVSTGLGFATQEERDERIKTDEDWATLLEKDAKEFWEKWYAQDLFASFHKLPEETREAWLEGKKAMDIKPLTKQLRRLGPGNHDDLMPLVRRLGAKELRVLYLVGELDKKYLELAGKLKDCPGITVSTIPLAGHILPLEAPDALAMRISKFVK